MYEMIFLWALALGYVIFAVIQDIRIAKEQSFQEAANLLNLDGTAWFYSIELNK